MIGDAAVILAQDGSIAPSNGGTGTASVGDDGSISVVKDGASIATPCSAVVMVHSGDRVRFEDRDGGTVITGNLTAKAVDSTSFNEIAVKANCIKRTANGIEVGNIDDSGAWVGMRAVIGSESYGLVDQDGIVMAEYAWDGQRIGGFGIRTETDHVTGDGGDVTNIYSLFGGIIMTANAYLYNPGTAGSSMMPGYFLISGGSVRMSVPEAKEPEGLTGRRVALRVESDGIYLEGDVYANGKKIG